MGWHRVACKSGVAYPDTAREKRAKGWKCCKFLTARDANRSIISPQAQQTLATEHPMNAPSELNFEDMLRIRLEVLRREHRDLDEAVRALEATGRPDQLTLRRLKKQKLTLKDHIVKLENQLIPDIIA
jgi:hypothetical protein